MCIIARGMALLVVLAAASVAEGQTRQPLTQESALARAEQKAPQVLVSLAQADVADADVAVASMLPNPVIGGGASSSFRGIALFSMSLPVFGQRHTAREVAKAQSRTAEFGVNVARLDARLVTALAWIDLWLAQQQLALARTDAERYDRTLAAAEARVKDGSAPELDRIRADADARRAHSIIDALASTRDAASARLAVLLGEPPEHAALSASGQPVALDAPPVASLVGSLHGHPLVQQATAAAHAAEATVTRDRRARLPQLGLAVQDWMARNTRHHDVRVMGSISLPVFDGPTTDRAESNQRAAEVNADAVEADLRGAAVAARADYVAAQRQCEALEVSVVPAMREAADRSEDAYRADLLDLSSTQTAAQARSDAERALLTCVADRARKWAQLAHAIGAPDAS